VGTSGARPKRCLFYPVPPARSGGGTDGGLINGRLQGFRPDTFQGVPRWLGSSNCTKAQRMTESSPVGWDWSRRPGDKGRHRLGRAPGRGARAPGNGRADRQADGQGAIGGVHPPRVPKAVDDRLLRETPTPPGGGRSFFFAAGTGGSHRADLGGGNRTMTGKRFSSARKRRADGIIGPSGGENGSIPTKARGAVTRLEVPSRSCRIGRAATGGRAGQTRGQSGAALSCPEYDPRGDGLRDRPERARAGSATRPASTFKEGFGKGVPLYKRHQDRPTC